VVLVGGPGTGKTHLATAIGVSGITRHGKRVRFFSTVDLVNALEQEKAQGKAGRIALSLLRMDLVILDELGYLPFSQAGGALLFHLLQAVRAHQRDDHDQPGLRRMVQRVRRRQDDHGAAGPAHAPLPHRGDGQPFGNWAIRRRTRSRPGIASTSSDTTCRSATRGGRSFPKLRRNGPSSTTSHTAGASLRRSGRWAIHRGHC
jgi:hypothetical protein